MSIAEEEGVGVSMRGGKAFELFEGKGRRVESLGELLGLTRGLESLLSGNGTFAATTAVITSLYPPHPSTSLITSHTSNARLKSPLQAFQTTSTSSVYRTSSSASSSSPKRISSIISGRGSSSPSEKEMARWVRAERRAAWVEGWEGEWREEEKREGGAEGRRAERIRERESRVAQWLLDAVGGR